MRDYYILKCYQSFPLENKLTDESLFSNYQFSKIAPVTSCYQLKLLLPKGIYVVNLSSDVTGICETTYCAT